MILQLVYFIQYILCQDNPDNWFKQMEKEMADFDRQFDEMSFSTPFLDGSTYQDCGKQVIQTDNILEFKSLNVSDPNTTVGLWKFNGMAKAEKVFPNWFIAFADNLTMDIPANCCVIPVTPQPNTSKSNPTSSRIRRILKSEIPAELVKLGLNEMYVGMLGLWPAIDGYNAGTLSKYQMALQVQDIMSKNPMASGYSGQITSFVQQLKADDESNCSFYANNTRICKNATNNNKPKEPEIYNASVENITQYFGPYNPNNTFKLDNKTYFYLMIGYNSMSYLKNESIIWQAAKRNAQLILKFNKLKEEDEVAKKKLKCVVNSSEISNILDLSQQVTLKGNLNKCGFTKPVQIDNQYAYVFNLDYTVPKVNKQCDVNVPWIPPQRNYYIPIESLMTSQECLTPNTLNTFLVDSLDSRVRFVKKDKIYEIIFEFAPFFVFETYDVCHSARAWKRIIENKTVANSNKTHEQWFPRHVQINTPVNTKAVVPIYMKMTVVFANGTELLGFRKMFLNRSEKATADKKSNSTTKAVKSSTTPEKTPPITLNNSIESYLVNATISLDASDYPLTKVVPMANHFLLNQVIQMCDVISSVVMQAYRIRLAIKDVFAELSLETSDLTKVNQCPPRGGCMKDQQCALYDDNNDFYCSCQGTVGLSCEIGDFKTLQDGLRKILDKIQVAPDSDLKYFRVGMLQAVNLLLSTDNIHQVVNIIYTNLPSKLTPLQTSTILDIIIRLKNQLITQYNQIDQTKDENIFVKHYPQRDWIKRVLKLVHTYIYNIFVITLHSVPGDITINSQWVSFTIQNVQEGMNETLVTLSESVLNPQSNAQLGRTNVSIKTTSKFSFKRVLFAAIDPQVFGRDNQDAPVNVVHFFDDKNQRVIPNEDLNITFYVPLYAEGVLTEDYRVIQVMNETTVPISTNLDDYVDPSNGDQPNSTVSSNNRRMLMIETGQSNYSRNNCTLIIITTDNIAKGWCSNPTYGYIQVSSINFLTIEDEDTSSDSDEGSSSKLIQALLMIFMIFILV